MAAATADEIAAVFRAEFGRVVATLVRLLGDIDLAEEAVQDAFVLAVERWPNAGLPANPGGWIVTTARRRAIDRLRRESTREARHVQALISSERTQPEVGVVQDDRLRLIFTCCHPALARSAQVALTLRLLGGLATPQIARAFLVPESTMAQRIVRAKRKIAAARIPYRVPAQAELTDRLPPVTAVVYLIYTAGHSGGTGAELADVALCDEALRLARLLAALMPDEPEVLGLLALLLLLQARGPARTAPDGTLVLLPDQDAVGGTRPSSPRGSPWCASACAAGRLVPTRSRPRSTRSTATPRPRARPTGSRCCTSTTSCWSSCRPRWWC